MYSTVIPSNDYPGYPIMGRETFDSFVNFSGFPWKAPFSGNLMICYASSESPTINPVLLL